MKIKAKILLSLLSVFIIMIGLAGAIYWQSGLASRYGMSSDESRTSFLTITDLRAKVRNLILVHFEEIFVNRLAHPEDLVKAKDGVDKALEVVQNRISLPHGSTEDSAAHKDITDLRESINRIVNQLDEAVVLLQKGDRAATELLLHNTILIEFRSNFLVTITRMIKEREAAADAEGANQRKSIAQLKLITIISTLIAGILVLTLATKLSSSIGQRLSSLERATHQIARGAYDVDLPSKGSDELSSLANSFNIMSFALRDARILLSQQQAMMVNSSKMSALGEMAGGIAHEINTPLAVIKMRAGQISRKISDTAINPTEIISLIKTIEATTDSIGRIVQGLRSFSRNSDDDPMTIHTVDELVESTLNLCSQRMKNRAIELKVAPVPNIKVMCRPDQISQVLINLLNNATDAIELLPEKWIELSFEVEDHGITLRVTDSGAGIIGELGNKLFEPFFTTKEIGKGTGLGLSISKTLINNHGGKLFLDSTANHTSFVVWLPVLGGESQS